MTAPAAASGPVGTRRPKTRHLLLVTILVFAWCALWGEASPANLLSGLAVSITIVFAGLRNRTVLDGLTSGRVNGAALIRLVGLVGLDLIRSTYTVALEVLTPGEGDEAIIAVPVSPEARHHYLVLVVGITVTPGTAVVDADLDDNTLYLHLLHQDRREEVVAHVQQLVELSCAAFPHSGERTGASDGPESSAGSGPADQEDDR